MLKVYGRFAPNQQERDSGSAWRPRRMVHVKVECTKFGVPENNKSPKLLSLDDLTIAGAGLEPATPAFMSAVPTVASSLFTGKYKACESLARRIAACAVLPIVLPNSGRAGQRLDEKRRDRCSSATASSRSW
jgi:hypothetical protein